MDRETLRKKFQSLLTPIHCNITIGESEAFGLSTLDLPVVIKVFKIPTSEKIYFYIYGDSIIEFDDLLIEDLEIIYKELTKLPL